MKTKVLAVIPAKANSRRLPGKNLALLGGKPLLQWTLDAARGSTLLDEIVVSTDSPEIRAACEGQGTWVPFLRPPVQSGDDVHASVPVLDMLARLGGASAYTHCVMLLPTAPLRTSRSIDEVVRLALERQRNVVTVSPLGLGVEHLRRVTESGALVPVMHGVPLNFQSQDTAPVYYLNGSIYCSPVKSLLWTRSFHHGEPLAHVMSAEESVDVDTAEDLVLAEYYLARAAQRAAACTTPAGGSASAVA